MRNKKRFRDTEAWKLIRTALQIALIALAVTAVIHLFGVLGLSEAAAEDAEYIDVAWVICVKGDHVNIRPFPNTKQEPSGWLEPGDAVYMDGKKKNGYVHCVNMSNESGEGWVHAGYLTDGPVETVDADAVVVGKGRIRTRKNVNGKRKGWLEPGDTVHVWFRSDSWCVTDHGYVMTKYIETEEYDGR